jgi:hypothetical protein
VGRGKREEGRRQNYPDSIFLFFQSIFRWLVPKDIRQNDGCSWYGSPMTAKMVVKSKNKE